MKAAYTQILIILVFLLSSCGTGMYMSGGYTDDLYYSPEAQPKYVARTVLLKRSSMRL